MIRRTQSTVQRDAKRKQLITHRRRSRTNFIDLRTLLLTVLAALATLAIGLVVVFGVDRWLTTQQLALAADLSTPTLFVLPTETPTLEGPTPGPTWTITPTILPTHTPFPTWIGYTNAQVSTAVPTYTPFATPDASDDSTAEPPPTAVPTASPLPTSTPDLSEPLTLISSLPPVGNVPEVALEAALDYEGRRARVELVIAAPNTSPDVWGELVFNLPAASVAGAIELGEVTAGREGAALQPSAAMLSDITLRVPLPEPVGPGEIARAEIHYVLNFLDVSSSATFPVGLTGYTGTVIRAGDWYPVLAPYDAGRGWRTFSYTPVGDPSLYPASNVTLAVQASPGITVAGSGPTGDRDGVWRFRAEGARGMAWFASDQYTRVASDANGIPVFSYHLIGYSRGGEAAGELAGQALTVYEDLYGPYPYQTLVVVQNGGRGDMEFTGLISISDRAYFGYTDGVATLLEVLIAHEMGHMWWYGQVGNDQVFEPWLDEGLATYSEVLYFENTAPRVGEVRLGNLQASAGSVPLDEISIYTYGSTVAYVDALYPHAAVMLDDLRSTMGDAAFFTFLRAYGRRYRGLLATGADFRSEAQSHTSADLSPVWAAYFSAP